MNAFHAEEEPFMELLQVDESIRTEQIQRLKNIRQSRDNRSVEHSLRDLRAAANGMDNVIPHILQAVEGYASIGEISDVLRETWGEYGG